MGRYLRASIAAVAASMRRVILAMGDGKFLAALLLAAAAAPAQEPAPTTIYNFGDVDPGAVVSGPNGVLYGTQYAMPGGVYSLTPPASPGGSWTPTAILTFGPQVEGFGPTGVMAIAADGTLYGATKMGGSSNCGTIFKLLPPASPGGAWEHKVIYIFNKDGGDGYAPAQGVVLGPGGVLYGSTGRGVSGSYSGTIFSLAPPATPDGSWVYTTLYEFTGGSDGSGPNELTVGPRGVLFGTTSSGALGFGTAYSLTPPSAPGGSWTFTTIYGFPGGDSGATPSGLAVGKNGVLYGAMKTAGNGSCDSGCGTVFSLTPPPAPGGTWTWDLLYQFPGGQTGGLPVGGVIIGDKGQLYGATGSGGPFDTGTVFSLVPPSSAGGLWTEKTLATFADGGASAFPASGVVFGFDGALYGVTFDLGPSVSDGTVYSVTR